MLYHQGIEKEVGVRVCMTKLPETFQFVSHGQWNLIATTSVHSLSTTSIATTSVHSLSTTSCGNGVPCVIWYCMVVDACEVVVFPHSPTQPSETWLEVMKLADMKFKITGENMSQDRVITVLTLIKAQVWKLAQTVGMPYMHLFWLLSWSKGPSLVSSGFMFTYQFVCVII